jgi:exopolysaccharide biosynthesis protein
MTAMAVTGADTSITIFGNAFTNEIMGNVVTASVELTAADGSTTVLTPEAISESSMDVTIPGTLATGNYALRAVKGPSSSNAAVISVIPGVTITDVNCNKKKGVLIVTGSGFGEKPEGTDADINIEVNGKVVDAISWSDTQIKVSVSSCPKRATITVNALYGSATNADTGSGSGGKPDKPCKGKKCQ